MKKTTIPKSAFKPKAFAYLRRVEQGETICITDHGRPVVDMIPHGKDDELLREMRGVITSYEGPDQPIDVAWDSAT